MNIIIMMMLISIKPDIAYHKDRHTAFFLDLHHMVMLRTLYFERSGKRRGKRIERRISLG